jgi:hypothetical protein
MDDPALGADERNLVVERPDDVDLELGRRVGLARGQDRGDRATQRESSRVANQPPCTVPIGL